MVQFVRTIFAVKRKTKVQLLYYCPRCESINEVPVDLQLLRLVCHDCGCELSGEAAILEVINPPPDEQ
jgi:hypothetical protein